MSAQTQYTIQSTAGAVPVRNEKGKKLNLLQLFCLQQYILHILLLGEVSMKKVKVHRYISGKRPEYAQYRSSDEESEDDDFLDRRAQRSFANRGDDSYDTSRKRDAAMSMEDSYRSDENADDPRLRRLGRLARHKSESEDDDANDDEGEERNRESRLRRYKERRIQEPEVLESEDEDVPSEGELRSDNDDKIQYTMDIERKRRIDLDDSGSGSDSELSDTEIEKRRQRLKNRMLQQRKDEEILERKEEEKHSESSDDDVASSYEEESESEEENEPRIKPLFVSKKDRATIAEKEKEAQKQKQMEQEARRLAKERRRQTLRMVEESVKKDLEKTKVSLRALYR